MVNAVSMRRRLDERLAWTLVAPLLAIASLDGKPLTIHGSLNYVPPPSSSSPRWWLLAVLLTLALVVGAAAFFLYRRQPGSPRAA